MKLERLYDIFPFVAFALVLIVLVIAR